MPRKIDMTGKKFGKVTVLEETDERDEFKRILWRCQCDCGKEVFLTRKYLMNAKNPNCGCVKEMEKSKKQNLSQLLLERSAKQSLCWYCIRSAAPPELQCIWDESKARRLPEGAEHVVTGEVKVGVHAGEKIVKVVSCPKFLSVYDENNQALLRKARMW